MVELLETGPKTAEHTVVLAHGAGAPMDSPFMNTVADGLGAKGVRVVRFEFAYMAKRRVDGSKRGPGRAEKLQGEYRAVLDAVGDPASTVIGGKSMGGRVASLIADDCGVRGLVCLGYPFHPPGRPQQLRTAHLAQLRTPTLIVQGTRDPFGTQQEVADYALSKSIRFHWSEDGDHSLKPRKKSGRTNEQNLDEAVEAIAGFCAAL